MPEPGNPQSLNRYSYAHNRPLVYIDAGGHFPIVPVLILGGALMGTTLIARASLEPPLSEYYSTAAASYGMPEQIVAGVMDSERSLDTNLLDHVETGVYALAPLGVTEHIVKRKFPDPGPGIGNIHVSTARNVSAYFAEHYPDSEDMQLNIHGMSTAEITKLLTDKNFNIKAAAATMRQLADYRFGSKGQPLTTAHADLAEWTIEDAVAIWHGYRYGVEHVSPPGHGEGFALNDFQNRDYNWEDLIGYATGTGAEESMRESLIYFLHYFRQ